MLRVLYSLWQGMKMNRAMQARGMLRAVDRVLAEQFGDLTSA
jgi:hypothetical protein